MKISYISLADRNRRNRLAGTRRFDLSERIELVERTLEGIKSLEIVVGEIHGAEHVYDFPVVALLSRKSTERLKFKAIPQFIPASYGYTN